MVAFTLSAFAANADGVTNDCRVDWNAVYQEIDGFGASSAFVGDWTSAWADMFFSTNTGIGLSLLRSRIAPDGTAPDYNIMQMAQARGARVWSTPWSPPADFKDSGTVNGGYFLSAFNQPYASQLANYVLNMKTNYQVDVYAVSVQNEPDYGTTAYESCVWTAQQIHDFIPYLYQALSNNGVGSTKILIAEQAVWNFAMTADAMGDLTTSNMVGILGAHDYDSSVAQVDSGGKPLWETEVSTLVGDYDGSIANGLYWAGQIHAFMTVVQANAFNYWWLIPKGNNNQGLTDASGTPAKRMYVLGQFSRFVRPGYYRIGAFNNAGTLISAYKDSGAGNFAIVAINTNSTSVTQFFNLTNFTAGSVTPWITSGTLSLSIQTAVPVTNASFSYVLPPQSVVTFVGQTNLNVTITMQPQNQMIEPGRNAAFSISVSGAMPLNYFWQQNGACIADATNATYSLTNVLASASGSQFSCVVSNAYGAITSSVATLTVTTPICVEPPSGIVAWWLGESNAVDIIGGNNGVLMNGAVFTNALVGNGFVFNGGTSYVQLPRNLFPSPNAGQFSFELWFETTTGGVILAQQAGTPFTSPSGGWVPHIYVGTDGNLYVQMFWDGAFDQISTSTPVNDGKFHHLAVTYDGVNEVVYLDGAAIGITRLQSSNYTSFFLCQLGTGYTSGWPAGNGGWYSFSGIIDQPTLYTNALTVEQVQSIYNAGSAGKCTDELLPVVIAQPTNQIVAASATAVFSVSATSLLPLTYQWLGSATVVTGATNATLTLTHATTNNPDNYAVVITSPYGSVTSSVVTLTITPPVCVEPPFGIVAWWLGGGNAVDIVGGNNGVLMNGVGFINALVGNGFVFNGGTSYVQLPPNLFPFPNAHPFSIELWFETAAGGVILAQQAGTPFNSLGDGWVPDMYVGIDGNLYVQMFWDGAFDQISTSTPVNDGKFHHLAVTYDGVNEVVYLDGAAIGALALAYSTYTSNFSCQFGTGYTQYWPAGNGGWYSFNGIIDQPTLYTTALTAAQIQSIYNAGSAGKCTDELMPVIIAQPTNQIVAVGATAVFSVSAMSLLPLTYQWLGGATAVAGATNATLTLTHATTNNPANYAVVITSPYGSVTSSVVTLTITNVTFNVSATLLPNRDVQLTMTGLPGNVFRILGSTNLLDWQTIATLTNFTGTVQFTDPAATNFNCRFYQLVTP